VHAQRIAQSRPSLQAGEPTARPIIAPDERLTEEWHALNLEADVTETCVASACMSIVGRYPAAVPATFGQLRKILQRPRAKAHPLAELGLAQSTRDEHRRLLRWMIEETAFDTWATPQAVLEILARRRKARKLRWTTVVKYAASIAGALQVLPLYHIAEPVTLSASPEWKTALKGLAAKAREESARIPTAVTFDQVKTAVQNATATATKRALALGWLVAGRTGDILKLRREDIVLSNGSLTVTYRRGKTVARRGPYSVSTLVPREWQILFDKMPDMPMNGSSTWATLKALRTVHKDLENRSIRRGALQTLARSGIEEQTLLLFSGHASVAMLRRYLAWGADTAANTSAMKKAAANLVAAANPVRQGL